MKGCFSRELFDVNLVIKEHNSKTGVKMTKKMRIMGSLLLFAVAVSACTTPSNITVNPQAQVPQINAAGSGLVRAVPDIAYIYIGVRSEGKSVADALNKNNQSARDIKDALVAQNVAEKDIQTSSFNVYPQQYNPAGQAVPTFYVVENTVYVTIRNLDSIGTILDLVANNGANSINGVYFDLSNKSVAQEQARQMAIEEAKKQAAQIASLTGVKLGKLMSINVYTSAAPYAMEGKGGGGAAMASPSVPISTGQMNITAEANLVYEIIQ
jgi:uncharacterized protein